MSIHSSVAHASGGAVGHGAIPRAADVHSGNPAYWNNPLRHELYYIPPDANVHAWAAVTREYTEAEGGRSRILKSQSTPGLVVYAVDHTGLAIVTDWTCLTDLLFFNPVQFFADHPYCCDIWCETTDTDVLTTSSAQSDPLLVRTASSADSQATVSEGSARSRSIAASEDSRSARSLGSGSESSLAETPNYALVARRSEMSPVFARHVRDVQHLFLLDHRISPPRASDFHATLHGR